MESVSCACVGESFREDNGGGEESIRRMEGSILEGRRGTKGNKSQKGSRNTRNWARAG